MSRVRERVFTSIPSPVWGKIYKQLYRTVNINGFIGTQLFYFTQLKEIVDFVEDNLRPKHIRIDQRQTGII